jgi:HAD superfamily hydrolase (TIGR01509 family)
MLKERTVADYDAYLFDWDGTLARTLESWLKILSNQAKAYNLTPTDRQISERFGDWSWALDFGLDPELLPTFKDEVVARAKADNPRAPLYNHALEVVRLLHAQGKKLALISASPRQVIEVATKHHKIAKQFDAIIAGEMITNHKPNPESLHAAMQLLGVRPARALMLGDSEKDLLAAKNAGIDSLLFYPPSHNLFYDESYLRSLGPCYVIASWQELLDQLQ